MKRSYLAVLTVGALCFLFQTAHATPLFSEAFNYTAGSGLAPGNINPGSLLAWSGGNAGLTIGSGDLTYAGLPDQGGNELSIQNATAGTSINQFANQTSGQVYYSFLLDVTTADGANDYITSLNPGTSVPNGGSDALAVYVYKDNTLGIRSTPASAVHTAGPLTLNTTYFVVVDYDFTAQAVNLWLDPTPGGSQPAATETLTGATGTTAIDNVGFKTQGTTGAFLVDNLLIGTTWSDVTPSSVPEPSTFAFAALGLLGGFIARLRRR
jgi:hypothetical protein